MQQRFDLINNGVKESLRGRTDMFPLLWYIFLYADEQPKGAIFYPARSEFYLFLTRTSARIPQLMKTPIKVILSFLKYGGPSFNYLPDLKN
jgi:hypothetical protein